MPHLLPHYRKLLPRFRSKRDDPSFLRLWGRWLQLNHLKPDSYVRLHKDFGVPLTFAVLRDVLRPAVFPLHKGGVVEYETIADVYRRASSCESELGYATGVLFSEQAPGRATLVSHRAALHAYAALHDQITPLIEGAARYYSLETKYGSIRHKALEKLRIQLPDDVFLPIVFKKDRFDLASPTVALGTFTAWCIRFPLIAAFARCDPQEHSRMNTYLPALLEEFRDAVRRFVWVHHQPRRRRTDVQAEWSRLRKPSFEDGPFSFCVVPRFSRGDLIHFADEMDVGIDNRKTHAISRDRKTLEEIAAWVLARSSRRHRGGMGARLPEYDVRLAALLLRRSVELQGTRLSAKHDRAKLFAGIVRATRRMQIQPLTLSTKKNFLGGEGRQKAGATLLHRLRERLGLEPDRRRSGRTVSHRVELEELDRDGTSGTKVSEYVTRTIDGYLTRTELAQRLGCTTQTLRNWERDREIEFEMKEKDGRSYSVVADDPEELARLRTLKSTIQSFAGDLDVSDRTIRRHLRKMGMTWKEALRSAGVLDQLARQIALSKVTPEQLVALLETSLDKEEE